MPPSTFSSKQAQAPRSNSRRTAKGSSAQPSRSGALNRQSGRARHSVVSKPQAPSRLIVLNKPWGVLTQFRDDAGRPTLADYVQVPGVYPAGRLDRDSEGLLLLTNDGALQARIAHPAHKMEKTYWAQVEGQASDAQLAQLAQGVLLNDGMTSPAKAEHLPPEAEQQLWPRDPPVRFRQSIPTSWIALTIAEGRNRQVRRMTAAVGLPTLRLVRVRIGPWQLDGLPLGQWREESIPSHL